MPQPALDTHAEVRKLKQAGCPEGQAVAMVDLVSRAPASPQIVSRLRRLESKVDAIEANMATKADLETLRADMVERTESLRADVVGRTATLRADMVERTETLRADMVRMLWIQSLALATLIISLAGLMLSLAG